MLKLRFYVATTTFDASTLTALSAVLVRHLPEWSSEALFGGSESQLVKVQLEDSESLLSEVESQGLVRFGLGTALLKGSAPSPVVFLNSSRNTRFLDSNRFSIEVDPKGLPVGVGNFAETLFRDLCTSLPVRYGYCTSHERFAASNLEVSGSRMRAVGVNLRRHLPGIYWLNFFGKTIVDYFGIVGTPESEYPALERLSEGLLVKTGVGPEGDLAVAASRSMLRSDVFFDRAEPGRVLTLPRFKTGET